MRVLLAGGSFASPQPVDAWHFAWNGRTYRGSYASVPLPDGRGVGLVNTLPLDAYLAGVLGSEISASWAPEAQRAQAIVSRTYALGRLRPARAYDVAAADSDQQYGGIDGESVECRSAIEATAGQIVTFAGAPARVAYSACCGGRTAASEDVWKTPYPYLTSIDDPNCVGTPNFTWTAQIARPQIDAGLGSRLRDVGSLRDVRLTFPAADARPTDVAFVGDMMSVDASPADVRNALGPSVVRSTFLHTAAYRASDGTLELGGTGRGHGVGMCQRGARALGDGGAAAAAIVAFYFPGTVLGRV